MRLQATEAATARPPAGGGEQGAEAVGLPVPPCEGEALCGQGEPQRLFGQTRHADWDAFATGAEPEAVSTGRDVVIGEIALRDRAGPVRRDVGDLGGLEGGGLVAVEVEHPPGVADRGVTLRAGDTEASGCGCDPDAGRGAAGRQPSGMGDARGVQENEVPGAVVEHRDVAHEGERGPTDPILGGSRGLTPIRLDFGRQMPPGPSSRGPACRVPARRHSDRG